VEGKTLMHDVNGDVIKSIRIEPVVEEAED
jgi:hypothetical protein